MTPSDSVFMELALRLGRRNRGATAENPSVGCIITNMKDGHTRIVGRGWTQPGGRPHAETMALERAGNASKGASVYVTLEPCAHQGRTPPCADALVQAKVARVVIAAEDPDPRVAGRGIDRLEQAGIEVVTGIGSGAARRDLAGFLSRIEKKRPYVTLKLAVSADGMIASQPGKPAEITGPAARAAGHLIRARSDAILVGRNTVISDDPQLTCRLPGLEARSPVRVVLDSRLSISPACRMFEGADQPPVWVFCVDPPPPAKQAKLREAGADIIALSPDQNGRPTIADVLGQLARRGINDLMVEGGAQVAEAFLRADLVDRAALFRSAKTVGPNGVPALGDLSLEAITGNARFVYDRTRRIGQDTLDWYCRKE